MTELSERLEKIAYGKSSRKRPDMSAGPLSLSQVTDNDIDEIINTKDWEALRILLEILRAHRSSHLSRAMMKPVVSASLFLLNGFPFPRNSPCIPSPIRSVTDPPLEQLDSLLRFLPVYFK